MASAFLSDVAGQAGPLSPDVLSGRLRITKTELASALGLSRDSVSKQSRVASPATQKRLRDVVEIINRVLPWRAPNWRLLPGIARRPCLRSAI
jgi:hypothetical protein